MGPKLPPAPKSDALWQRALADASNDAQPQNKELTLLRRRGKSFRRHRTYGN